MATEPPGSGVPKEEAPPVETDSKAEGLNTRRASTTRRSRRKKDEETANTPDTKAKKEKETKPKEKPARAPRRPREKSTTTAAARKKAKLEQPNEATPGADAAATAPTPQTPSQQEQQSQQPHQPLQHQQMTTPPQPASQQPVTTQASTSIPTPSQPPSQTPTPVPAPAPAPVSASSATAAPPSAPPAPTYSPSPHPPQTSTPAYTIPQSYPPRPHSQPPPPQPSQKPPRTSGQNFDPIRSAFGTTSPAPAYSPPTHTISPQNNYRASASPAISSIIDPPTQNSQHAYPQLTRSTSGGHIPTASSPAPPAMASQPSHPSLAPSPLPVSSPSHGPVPSPQPLPPSNHHASYTASDQRPPGSQSSLSGSSAPAAQEQAAQPQQPPRQIDTPVQAPTPQRPQQSSDAMDIDPKDQTAPSAKKDKGAGTAPSSKAPSPKPGRAAKEAPPLPQGSGLITNALFGGPDDSKSPDARSTPNIIVHVPLQKGNQIVNFAQLAEEQYGFAALHPRLAAHKERLARVAAAGAALERNDKGKSAGESAEEDLSLDVDRDSDMDGDITMGGAGNGTNGAPSEASDGKRRRRKKVEEYDRDDPFVDDSEMAWQEQAAASKDGFFVYSGPLVPEGDKVQVERLVLYTHFFGIILILTWFDSADGTIKRGRGRGRGTGRARSLASHPHVPIAAAVPISQDTGLPLRGPGSRGGTSRRARGSKKADAEKHSDRNGSAPSPAHEGRGGRGGGAAGRGGGSSTRGGKSSTPSTPSHNTNSPSVMSMMDLAPAPPNLTPSQNSNIAPAPGPSPLAGPSL